MRISNKLISERETFVKAMVKVNPNIKGGELQAHLTAQDGKMMNPSTLYRLMREAKDSLRVTNRPPVTMVHRHAVQNTEALNLLRNARRTPAEVATVATASIQTLTQELSKRFKEASPLGQQLMLSLLK